MLAVFSLQIYLCFFNGLTWLGKRKDVCVPASARGNLKISYTVCCENVIFRELRY